jgi:hypothetical protein
VKLTATEQALWDAFPTGTEVVAEGETVRAEVLGELLADPRGDAPAARAPAVHLRGVRITGRLALQFTQVRHPVLLEGCEFEQIPDLYWARTGFLSLRDSTLPGLWAANIQVDGHLRLSGCTFTGDVHLPGARVTGGVLLERARVTTADRRALNCERISVGGDIVARDLVADGELRLVDATLGGRLNLNGCRLSAPGAIALAASGLTSGGVFAQGGTIVGETRLRRARLSGSLTLAGATLENPGGVALRADRAVIENGVFLIRGFRSVGEIRLSAARVSRNLIMDGATLRNPGGVAFTGDTMTLDGSLTAHDGFRATGEVSLCDAQVNGPVQLEGARLENPGGAALTANGLTVAGVLNCCDGFTAHGRVRLSSARVANRLCFDNATLSSTEGSALRAWRLEAAELTLRTAEPISGPVDLRYSRVGLLRDSPSAWPSELLLDGASYQTLEPRDRVADRLRWLRLDPAGYLPQPYEQLAGTYRRLGEESNSRTVLLAGQRHRRGTLPWYARTWGYLQDATVGYGYRPARAAVWLLILLALGTIAFASGQHVTTGEPGPPFNPFVYALDVLVPLIDFGQQQSYVPTGNGQWLTEALTALGWILTTTVAAGITRALRR